ncbi:MAG: hypothetical protein D6798_06695 [Deltaproteobacteria bacterium]|nr:MAG: hypothetical protein D6798_06695 [Deltaproteobacteria bacterium]
MTDVTSDAARDARVQQLQRILMEEPDPEARARAHLELARIAIGDGGVDASVRHLREALLLDGRLEAARQLLHELGETSRISNPSRAGRRDAVRTLLGRVRRRRR